MLEVTHARMEHWSQVEKMLPRVWEDDYVLDSWRDWVQRPEEGLTIVALYDGKVVGTSYVAYRTPKLAWFQGLRIDPEYQRRGIAGEMSRFALATLKQAGFERALASIDEDNLPSQKAAERGGFHRLYNYLALEPGEGFPIADRAAGQIPAWEKAPLDQTEEYLDVLRRTLHPPRDMVLFAWSLHLPQEASVLPELAFEKYHFLFGWHEQAEHGWAAIYDFEEHDDQEKAEPIIIMSPACSDPAVWPRALTSLEALLSTRKRPFYLWLTADDPLYAATLAAGYRKRPDAGYQIWELLL